jgi:UDP:flavonoid glycosyltransferase YjiC (YdhE family)
MITHGGANSVMEAMHFGVPLLVTPICNDQFHNARFVERARTGRALDLGTAGPEAVWDALAALLSDGAERAAANRASISYRERGGAKRAAELVLACASR